MTKDQLWKEYEYEKMIKEMLAEELSWLRDRIIPELRADIKRKDEALKESILTICRLCKEKYPRHKDCTSCDEIDGYRQTLSTEEDASQ